MHYFYFYLEAKVVILSFDVYYLTVDCDGNDYLGHKTKYWSTWWEFDQSQHLIISRKRNHWWTKQERCEDHLVTNHVIWTINPQSTTCATELCSRVKHLPASVPPHKDLEINHGMNYWFCFAKYPMLWCVSDTPLASKDPATIHFVNFQLTMTEC